MMAARTIPALPTVHGGSCEAAHELVRRELVCNTAPRQLVIRNRRCAASGVSSMEKRARAPGLYRPPWVDMVEVVWKLTYWEDAT